MTHFRHCCAALFAAFLLSFMVTQAYAYLQVTPMRFVFEKNTRSLSLVFLNSDTKTHKFRLKWRMMKMDQKGAYYDVPLDETDAHSVPNMVVFSPRQVTLGPGGRQKVRLSLRAPADLPDGEYRGHLMFYDVTEQEEKNNDSGKMGFSIDVTLGLTVPVIVRHGDIKPGEISIGPTAFNASADPQVLQLELGHTTGQASEYGQVLVKSVVNGTKETVGTVSNVALYPEVDKRIITMDLRRKLPPGSTVDISYEGKHEYEGQILAEKQITLP